MRHRTQGFSFRGFVALADLLFALSAGLLLLDPRSIHAQEPPLSAQTSVPPAHEPELRGESVPDDSAEVLRVRADLKKLTALLDKLEAETSHVEQRARQVLRSE